MPKKPVTPNEPVTAALLPIPRTLVYKRTHNKGCGEDGRCNGGDPCAAGCFGCCDCMGEVRSIEFDAVIGIGGTGREATKNGLAGKLHWIGIGRNIGIMPVDWRGPLLTFDHYLNYGVGGDLLVNIAPDLETWMNDPHRRFSLTFPPIVEAQIAIILALAQNEPPSLSRPGAGYRPRLRPGCCTTH